MSAVYPFPGNLDAQSGSVQTPEAASVRKVAGRRPTTLLLRLGLLNVLALSLVAVAWFEGYVAMVIQADQTHLSVLIVVVFVLGLVISIYRGVEINREVNQLSRFLHSTTSIIPDINTGATNELMQIANGSMGSLRLRLSHRIASVRHIANVLVLLGLIGTVLGFIIALSGVNPESASDVEGIAPMVSTLISGMSTALYTTLIGSILNVWLSANYQMLSSGTVELMSLWLDAGEQATTVQVNSSDA